MDFSQTYPGLPSMVPAIRAFIAALLDGSPRREDAAVIVSELATNSLRHTPSGAPDGQIWVAVSITTGWARIAVTDQGGGGWERAVGHPGEDEETGRGLEIVVAMADKFGHDITEAGQTVWAELTWSGSETAAAVATGGGSPAAVPARTPGIPEPRRRPALLDELAAQIRYVGLHAEPAGDHLNASFHRGAVDHIPVWFVAGEEYTFVIGDDRAPAVDVVEAVELLIGLLASPMSDYTRRQMEQLRRARGDG